MTHPEILISAAASSRPCPDRLHRGRGGAARPTRRPATVDRCLPAEKRHRTGDGRERPPRRRLADVHRAAEVAIDLRRDPTGGDGVQRPTARTTSRITTAPARTACRATLGSTARRRGRTPPDEGIVTGSVLDDASASRSARPRRRCRSCTPTQVVVQLADGAPTRCRTPPRTPRPTRPSAALFSSADLTDHRRRLADRRRATRTTGSPARTAW